MAELSSKALHSVWLFKVLACDLQLDGPVVQDFVSQVRVSFVDLAADRRTTQGQNWWLEEQQGHLSHSDTWMNMHLLQS